MKICINLLPERRKKEIIRRKRIRKIIQQEFLSFLLVLIFVGSLFLANFILKIQNESTEKFFLIGDFGEKYQTVKLYEKEFEEVNRKISIIDKFQDKHLRWFGILTDFFEIIPVGMYLSDFSTKENQVLLMGKAQERVVLIDFQEKIEKIDCFEKVNVPISNLVEKKDIDFQMDFFIKEECLIEKKDE